MSRAPTGSAFSRSSSPRLPSPDGEMVSCLGQRKRGSLLCLAIRADGVEKAERGHSNPRSLPGLVQARQRPGSGRRGCVRQSREMQPTSILRSISGRGLGARSSER
jgi:hypothetical protein